MPLHVRIVSPDYCTFDADAAFVAVPSTDGELGFLPKHASEICTLGSGYVRICDEQMGETSHTIAVNEGYVQIANDEVIILSERSCDMARVDREEITSRLKGFEDELVNLSEDDARRSYLYNEAAWCKLLLAT